MAVTYNFTAEEFRQRFADLERERPLAVRRGIVSAAFAGAEYIARIVPKDLGTLRQSVRAQVQPGGALIVVDAPHAGIIEMGSRPHWAPLGVLVEWCKRHGASTDQEAFRFARAIQAKIAREGTKPTWFMRRSIPRLRKILQLEVERELGIGGGGG